MSQKTVIVIQTSESANYFIQNIDKYNDYHWICYDPRAQQILMNSKIPFETDDEILSQYNVKMKKWEEIANKLSISWFKNIIPFNFRVIESNEICYAREFNYFFVGLFRYFELMRCLSLKFPKAKLLTAETEYLGHCQSIRWQAQESPVGALLEKFNGFWNFNYKVTSLPRKVVERQKKMGRFIPSLLRLNNDRIARASDEICLVSGNPKLFQTILSDKNKVSQFCAKRFVHVQSLKEALSAFFNHRVGVFANKDDERESHEGIEEIITKLKSDNPFVIEEYDFLPFVLDRIHYLYEYLIGPLASAREQLKKFFKEANMCAVVLDEDATPFNRLLAQTSKSFNVPSVVVMHGLPRLPLGFIPLIADKIAVWGKVEKKVLEEWGVNAEQVTVTGCPKYEDLKKDADFKINKSRVCKKYGWIIDSPIISIMAPFFRSNPMERFQRRNWEPKKVMYLAELFLKIAREFPSINFIYKFHKGTWDVEAYSLLLQREGPCPNNLKWVCEGTAVNYIKASDLVFSDTSSAGLEAVLLQKPFIYMDFVEGQDICQFDRHGASCTVTNAEALRKIIHEFSEHNLPISDWVRDQEALIDAFLAGRNSNAETGVFEMIQNVIHNSRLSKESKFDAKIIETIA